MEILPGEARRVGCKNCGAKIELPESFWQQRASNDASQAKGSSPEAETDDELRQLREQGLNTLSAEAIEKLEARGFYLSQDGRIQAKFKPKKRGLFRKPQFDIRYLSPDDIIELAGGALPAEERRICPRCQAVIARKAKRCEWCGVTLSD
jgi:hypothetical protein